MGGRGGWRVEGVVSGPEVIDENLIRDFLRVGVEWEGNKREDQHRPPFPTTHCECCFVVFSLFLSLFHQSNERSL